MAGGDRWDTRTAVGRNRPDSGTPEPERYPAPVAGKGRRDTANAKSIDSIDYAIEKLDQARKAYELFQEQWMPVGLEVRRLNRGLWERLDAYPGWDGNRRLSARARGVPLRGRVIRLRIAPA